MKFIKLDPKVIVQGNSGRLYTIMSGTSPARSCDQCYFQKVEFVGPCVNYYCDNDKVTKEFNKSCNCLMRNDKYFKLLEGGL